MSKNTYVFTYDLAATDDYEEAIRVLEQNGSVRFINVTSGAIEMKLTNTTVIGEFADREEALEATLHALRRADICPTRALLLPLTSLNDIVIHGPEFQILTFIPASGDRRIEQEALAQLAAQAFDV